MRAVLRFLDALVDCVVFLVAICVVGVGVYAIWDSVQIENGASSEVWASWKPTSAGTESFDELRAQNPDVFGWLSIDGTGIDYPVVQGKTNEEYLNKDARGEFSLTGSIFLDCRNSADFTDALSVVYGHHMESSLMFGDLECYADVGYFVGHRSARLYYGGTWHMILFFAFLQADAYDSGVYDVGLSSSEIPEYIERVTGRSVVARNAVERDAAHCIALSTCSNDATNARYVLVGYMS